MAKRNLTQGELFEIRQALHVAVIDALMSARRWEPSDLLFQGGTSLHLAHGSPRFSEDLDFLVDSSLNLGDLSASIKSRLSGLSWFPADMSLSVGKSKEARNPHSFVVTLGGKQVIGAVRVKVEMWMTDRNTISPLGLVVAPIQVASGMGAGMRTFVPTAVIGEIFADKVFALGARDYIKPRDVFDIDWIVANHEGVACSERQMEIRFATYPNMSIEEWLSRADVRLSQLKASNAAIKKELGRWLPSYYALGDDDIARMIHRSVEALNSGRQLVDAIASRSGASPSP